MPGVQIRAFEPRDLEQQLTLLEQCFEGLSIDRERVRRKWAFEDNPASDPQVPTAWVAEESGRLIGTYGLLPLRFLADGKPCAGLAGVDFCVAPDARGRGLGRKLSDAFLDTPGSRLRLITSPTEATVALMRKRGATVLETRAEGALFGLPAPFDAALGAPDVPLQAVVDFGPEFDAFGLELGRHHRRLVLRDARYLNWRYRDDPFVRHVALAAKGESQVRGFAVLTIAQSDAQGFVSELAVQPQDADAARALLRGLVAAAQERSLSAIVVHELRPAIRRLLVESGFVQLDEPAPDVTLLDLEAPIADSDWYSSPGDGDVLFRIGGD